jgi:hypothetical protein
LTREKQLSALSGQLSGFVNHERHEKHEENTKLET